MFSMPRFQSTIAFPLPENPSTFTSIKGEMAGIEMLRSKTRLRCHKEEYTCPAHQKRRVTGSSLLPRWDSEGKRAVRMHSVLATPPFQRSCRPWATPVSCAVPGAGGDYRTAQAGQGWRVSTLLYGARGKHFRL